jgi:dimethylglycine dehydrogenase
MARVPLLGTQGVNRVINGPIPYAPDGLPLIGPMPGVPNAYEACVFTFGITQGGGAGKVMAEWITEGQTEWDMWSSDPRRYTDYTDQQYCHDKAMETYGHEYGMHFPYKAWPAGRDRKQSALQSRLVAAGAQFGAYNGWERANWFAAEGDDTSLEATETWNSAGPWEPRIREECEAVRDHCGMLPITGFSRIKVQGPGARAYVDGLTASRLPKPGRVSLAYFGDDRGRCLTEMSVMVHSEDEVGLITAAVAQWHDAEIFSRGAPEGITVTDHTQDVECLLVTGPAARDILAPLTTGHDLTKGWLTASFEGTVAGQQCALLRVSFAGELGWEIHAAPDAMPAIWDALAGAGVKPFGMYALNSMRIEKGYKAWKGDLSTDYSLLELGLDRFVKLDKDVPFTGQAAILAEKQRGVKKAFTALTLDTLPEADAPYMSMIWHGGEIVGETTSGAYGYRTGKSIALGMIRPDLLAAGTKVEVEIYGQKVPATVQGDVSLWDAENARIRA